MCKTHEYNRHQQFEGSSSIQRQGQTKRSDMTKGFESMGGILYNVVYEKKIKKT